MKFNIVYLYGYYKYWIVAVSYTHLDVYKRQPGTVALSHTPHNTMYTPYTTPRHCTAARGPSGPQTHI